MTQKSPTLWKSNPAKSAGVAYSNSAITYNSSTTAYSSASVGLDEYAKTPGVWTPVTKTPTAFAANPAANTKLYPFDSASHTYDSAVDTYDGVVSGQDFGDTATPTQWAGL